MTNTHTPTNAQRLLRLLERLRPQMQGPLFRRLSELQLSHSHMRVLHVVYEEQAISMKELADRLQITPPSITALSRRLVQSGLVERRPHADDSRVALLALTAEGRALRDQLHAAHVQRVGQLLANLSPEEQTLFLDLLDRATRDEQGPGCHAGQPEIGRSADGPPLDPDSAS